MIVENVNDLECDLVPLDKIKVNLNNRHLLTLKDNFNVKEVEHFVEWIGQRLFSYQFATFYEYKLELQKAECTVSHELFKDYDNRITNEKEDFYRFSFQVKTSIENKHQIVNKGPDKLENVEWNFSISFINIEGDIRKDLESAARATRSSDSDMIRCSPHSEVDARPGSSTKRSSSNPSAPDTALSWMSFSSKTR